MTDPDDSSDETPPPKKADALDLARDIADAYRGGARTPGRSTARRNTPAPTSRPSRDEASPLADLIGQVVRDQGWDEQLAATRVFTQWAAIVGAEVAQHSEVVSLDEGIVEVRAASTAWATQLRFLAPRIVAKLNEELGDGSVVRIDVHGPQAPSWKNGRRSIRGARGPRDTYG